ncbi:MAG: TolC family protein [Rikenellaceae bacterium]
MLKSKSFRVLFVASSLVLLTLQSHAQNDYNQIEGDSIAMSLEECLEFAKINSITLKQAQLSIDNSIADELTASGVFLPSVSAAIGQNFIATPLVSGTKASYSGSYGVDLSMPIYSGGANRASLEQSKINSEMAELSLAEQENSLEIAVTEVFVQMLYMMEQIEVAKNGLVLSEKSLERGKDYLEVGYINKSELALLESAKASNEYDVVVAQSTLSNLQVMLKQLLEISQDVYIGAAAPELSNAVILSPIYSVGEVYNSALEFRPEIAYSKLSISAAELDVKIAKAGYLPTVSVSAGAGISHNSSSDYTFSGQMRNNFTTSIGASVSVPIFSNYRNKVATVKAQNSVNSASLSLTDAEKELYQTIETLHNNASNAQMQYAASDVKLKAAQVSLELLTEQYNEGMKNIIELLTEQDNYLDSSQEYLTNKYQFILNRALLEYYKTDLIKL